MVSNIGILHKILSSINHLFALCKMVSSIVNNWMVLVDLALGP